MEGVVTRIGEALGVVRISFLVGCRLGIIAFSQEPDEASEGDPVERVLRAAFVREDRPGTRREAHAKLLDLHAAPFRDEEVACLMDENEDRENEEEEEESEHGENDYLH